MPGSNHETPPSPLTTILRPADGRASSGFLLAAQTPPKRLNLAHAIGANLFADLVIRNGKANLLLEASPNRHILGFVTRQVNARGPAVAGTIAIGTVGAKQPALGSS